MKVVAVVNNGMVKYSKSITMDECAKEIDAFAREVLDTMNDTDKLLKMLNATPKTETFTNEQKATALVELVNTYSTVGEVHRQILMAECFKVNAETAFNILVSK